MTSILNRKMVTGGPDGLRHAASRPWSRHMTPTGKEILLFFIVGKFLFIISGGLWVRLEAEWKENYNNQTLPIQRTRNIFTGKTPSRTKATRLV